jgi:uncharacterized repeat protein (TIGR03803 family)
VTKTPIVITSAILFTIQVQAQDTGAGALSSTTSNVYGATVNGGTYGYGVVYRIDQAGNETVLHSFDTGPNGSTGPDGILPRGNIITDSAGNLYGATARGGKYNAGAVFKIDTDGNESILHNFGGSQGVFPTSLIRDSGGNLYGTTWFGGPNGSGILYKLNAIGNGTILHAFTGGVDGGGPVAGVIRDSAGNLYGTASSGGLYGFGVVYKVDASANQTVLYAFTGGADGANPSAP